jgi:hypothetical protein
VNRLTRLSIIAATVALAGAAILGGASDDALATDRGSNKPTAEEFRADMRVLWEDHIVWTRLYIVSAATQSTDLADIGPTAERLFRNQADIGNAIAAFYGDAAGTTLTGLLNDHIGVAAEAISKARDGDQAGLEDALARWYDNADDIARFLADANPANWPFDMMSAHMRHHLDLTMEEAVARLSGDYAADIAAYDKVHVQILEMADMLSDGIVRQFPNEFRGH